MTFSYLSEIIFRKKFQAAPRVRLTIWKIMLKTSFFSMQPIDVEEIRNIIKDMKNVGAGIDKINAKIFKTTC